MIQMRYGKTHNSEMLTLAILCSAIAVQWSLIGTFPMNHPRRWWLEPGALITSSPPFVAALAFIPNGVLSLISSFLAIVLWVYWFRFLTWLLLGWLRELGRTRNLTSCTVEEWPDLVASWAIPSESSPTLL